MRDNFHCLCLHTQTEADGKDVSIVSVSCVNIL